MANMQALQRQGWYLSADGIDECSDNANTTVDRIIQVALDCDLKDIGEKHLPDGINKKAVDTVDGPFVVQITKIRNVSAPKDNEGSQGAPPLFKVTLTDGHSTCIGVEIQKIPNLGLQTPPGTKLKLIGKVKVEHGFLQLNPSNAKILGGNVEKLVHNWQLKKSLANHSRTDGGAPPFVPFGQRRRDVEPLIPRKPAGAFKSLESKVPAEGEGEDSEFQQQRQANIASIQKTAAATGSSRIKSLVGSKQNEKDQQVAKIMDMGFSADQASFALRQHPGDLQEAINSLLSSGGGGGGGGGFGGDRGGRGRGGGGGMGGGRPSRNNGEDAGSRPDIRHGGERGGRRGRGEDEEDASFQGRPSAPATIFDFVTNKIPSSKKGSRKEDKPSMPTERKEESRPAIQNETTRSSTGPEAQQQAQPAQQQQRRISEGDGDERRGPPNLPPRLLKQQQQQREEQRQQQQQQQRGRGGQQRTGGQPRSGGGGGSSYDRAPRGYDQGYDPRHRNRAYHDGRYDPRYDHMRGGNYNQHHYQQQQQQQQQQQDYEYNRGYNRPPQNRHYQTDQRAYQQQQQQQQQHQHNDRRNNPYANRQNGERRQPQQLVQQQQQQPQQAEQEQEHIEEWRDVPGASSQPVVTDSTHPTSVPPLSAANCDNTASTSSVPSVSSSSSSVAADAGTEPPAPAVVVASSTVVMSSEQLAAAGGIYTSSPMDNNSNSTIGYTVVPAPTSGGPGGQYVVNHMPMMLQQQMQNLHISQPPPPPQQQPPAQPQIQYHYPQQQQQQQMDGKREIRPGEYCFAKYWQDQKFYRAVIQSVDGEAENAQVLFLDYGNVESCSYADIQAPKQPTWEANSGAVTMVTESAQGVSMPGILIQPPPQMTFMSAFPPAAASGDPYAAAMAAAAGGGQIPHTAYVQQPSSEHYMAAVALQQQLQQQQQQQQQQQIQQQQQ